jgi:hypothetical protein
MNAYDSELQMFVETAHEIDYARLRFLRWLVEHDHLQGDGYIAGPIPSANNDEDRDRLLAELAS